MRVLALPRYTRLGASSRLRTYQYIPFLESQGFVIYTLPLLDDDYLRGIYAGKTKYLKVIKSYIVRLWHVLSKRDYDVLWVEKEFFPWLPESFVKRILSGRTRLLIDYDDAVFHNYDRHRSWFVRTMLGCKVDQIMARADMVTAGNDYLAARARAAGCQRVEGLPTVIDLDRYVGADVLPANEAVTIGWIGSPSTAPYLHRLAPLAEKLRNKYQVRFVAIGANSEQVEGTPFQAQAWSESTEVEQLRGLDVGIMPLDDGPWECGKCGYKLIQYMACSIPVVASPVGVNQDIVEHGKNGFLASSEHEWEDSLTTLILDARLRQKLGQAGRKRVEQTYCLQVQGPRLASLLSQLSFLSRGA